MVLGHICLMDLVLVLIVDVLMFWYFDQLQFTRHHRRRTPHRRQRDTHPQPTLWRRRWAILIRKVLGTPSSSLWRLGVEEMAFGRACEFSYILFIIIFYHINYFIIFYINYLLKSNVSDYVLELQLCCFVLLLCPGHVFLVDLLEEPDGFFFCFYLVVDLHIYLVWDELIWEIRWICVPDFSYIVFVIWLDLLCFTMYK